MCCCEVRPGWWPRACGGARPETLSRPRGVRVTIGGHGMTEFCSAFDLAMVKTQMTRDDHDDIAADSADFDGAGFDGDQYDLEERQALRRVIGLSTELQDITE